MSALDIGSASGVVERAGSSARPRLLALVASAPVLAFVCSRIAVLAAGAAGVLTLNKHDGTAAGATLRALGPAGNVLAGSVDRFDSGFYVSIATHGYGAASSGSLAFFPLYPLLIRALSPLTGSPVLAGAVVSAAAFLAALLSLHRLTGLELGRRAADVAVWLLAFAPLSFFFTAVYTESLFLALAVGSLLAARTGRWRLACGLGALATLTRPVGILLAVALAVARCSERRGPDRSLAWVLALPGVLLGYLAVLSAGGHGWLAPFSAQAKWGRVSSGPVAAIISAAWDALRGLAHIARGGTIYDPVRGGPLNPDVESLVLFAVLAISVAALVECWRRLPRCYGAFSAAALLMTLSSPAIGQPLWSFDRFALTIFPLWMAAGAWLSRRRLAVPVIVLGAGLLVFYTLQFSSWSFVA